MTDENSTTETIVTGRRHFLRQAGVAAGFLGLGALPADAADALAQAREVLAAIPEAPGESVMGLQHDPIARVRVALLGLGMRGYGQLQVMCNVPKDKFDIVALCDVREPETEKAASYARRKGFKPDSYTGSATAWQEMLQRDDIDLVIISTPWEDHVPMSVYAMQQGVHVAVEVPAAYTLDDCWALVNTAEETRRNCMMLENVCYGEEELWLLNMVAHGVFGELTHAEAAYIRGYSLPLIAKFPNMVSITTLRRWRKEYEWDEKKDLATINPRKIKDMILKNVQAINMGKKMPYRPDDIAKLASAWEKMDNTQKHAFYCMEAFNGFADFMIDKAARKSDKDRKAMIDKLKEFRALQDEYVNSLLD